MDCPAMKKFRDVKVKVTFLSHKRELHDIIFVHVNFSWYSFRTASYYCKTNLFSQRKCIVFVIVSSVQELNA